MFKSTNEFDIAAYQILQKLVNSGKLEKPSQEMSDNDYCEALELLEKRRHITGLQCQRTAANTVAVNIMQNVAATYEGLAFIEKFNFD